VERSPKLDHRADRGLAQTHAIADLAATPEPDWSRFLSSLKNLS
jgi:hypothetical protein